MQFRIRKGLDLSLPGRPEQAIGDGPPVSTVAVLGRDYPGLRPEFRVSQGDRVRTGQALFVDRARPEITFTAPATGTVTAIEHGQPRRFDELVIRVESEVPEYFEHSGERLGSAGTRALLLESGLWSSFLTRPYGRIPDPDQVPRAIFVTAIDTNPLAADVFTVVGPCLRQFRRGVEALTSLTEGKVYVCQPPGAHLVESDEQVVMATFSGPHPAGLAGTHIHHLMPVSAQRTVWQVGYQDVIAIGHLLETGALWTERIVALAGPALLAPRLIRTRLGASLDDLLEGEPVNGNIWPASGSVLTGRPSAYLGRYHAQVTVLGGEAQGPGERTFGQPRRTAPGASDAPLVPLERLDAVLPMDILAVPLMRALAVGDIDSAERLGCLELLEEDVALLSYLCAERCDYGDLLRRALDELEGA